VGCAGRVTSFAETSDGRYLVTLTGVCRFRVGDELPARTPYRQVRADFTAFEADLREGEPHSARTARPDRPCCRPCAAISTIAAWPSTGPAPRPRRPTP
jgi:Lon protease-like protein